MVQYSAVPNQGAPRRVAFGKRIKERLEESALRLYDTVDHTLTIAAPLLIFFGVIKILAVVGLPHDYLKELEDIHFLSVKGSLVVIAIAVPSHLAVSFFLGKK